MAESGRGGAPTPTRSASASKPTADPADCGGACPGSPQPDAGGLIPFAEMQPFVVWEQFLDRLRPHEGALFAILAELGLARLGGGVLRLAGTAQTFARNHLRDQAPLRAHLESLLQQHLGAPFKLELVEGEPSLPELPSLGLEERRREELRQQEAERQVLESPQIQALRAQFDAQVRSVRPRGSSSQARTLSS